MPLSGPILRSPTTKFSRLDRVKIAVEFMQSPVGQRVRNALTNRMRRYAKQAGYTVENLILGKADVSAFLQDLRESPFPPKGDDEEKPDDKRPALGPGDGLPDPRLADLARGAIDLQPEEGPTLDDLYDSAILRVNANDCLDFFLSSDIEQDLSAFLLFFSPLMKPQQAAILLRSLREILPGTQIVQGPTVGGKQAKQADAPPSALAAPDDDSENPFASDAQGDDSDNDDEEDPDFGDDEVDGEDDFDVGDDVAAGLDTDDEFDAAADTEDPDFGDDSDNDDEEEDDEDDEFDPDEAVESLFSEDFPSPDEDDEEDDEFDPDEQDPDSDDEDSDDPFAADAEDGDEEDPDAVRSSYAPGDDEEDDPDAAGDDEQDPEDVDVTSPEFASGTNAKGGKPVPPGYNAGAPQFDDERPVSTQEPPAGNAPPQGAPQFDTDNPDALPWVFLCTTDEVNLAKDGSVPPPEDPNAQQGITGFPAKGSSDGPTPPKPGDPKAAIGGPGAAGGGEEEPGADGEDPTAMGDDPDAMGADGEDPGADASGDEFGDDPDARAAALQNEPSDQPGLGQEPGDGEMPGDGELPGGQPDDTGAASADAPPDDDPLGQLGDEPDTPPDDGTIPPDELPPDDEEDPLNPDDDEEDTDEADTSPGYLFDSVNNLLGDPPC